MVGLQNLDLPIGVRIPVSQFDCGIWMVNFGLINLGINQFENQTFLKVKKLLVYQI
jgi:hypothetical protein